MRRIAVRAVRAHLVKFTLSWLKMYLDTDASLEAIVDKLTLIGLEVESVEDRAKALYRGSERVYDWLMSPHRKTIAHHARTFGLSPREGLHECLSPYAQISQATAGFDLPSMAAMVPCVKKSEAVRRTSKRPPIAT